MPTAERMDPMTFVKGAPMVPINLGPTAPFMNICAAAARVERRRRRRRRRCQQKERRAESSWQGLESKNKNKRQLRHGGSHAVLVNLSSGVNCTSIIRTWKMPMKVKK
jgi:hypothetical protein